MVELPRRPMRKSFLPLALLPFTLVMGCSEQAEIRHYTVPKSIAAKPDAPPISQPAVESRMLAAMVPHGEMAWFFKATGPDAAVNSRVDAFVDFLKSIRFGEEKDAKPTWKLPDDWKQLPGSEFRFATIQIATSDEPIEMTVIPLPLNGEMDDDYVLSNVNRWREQLHLSTIQKSQLADETKKLNLEGAKQAIYVNLFGKLKANTMGRPPFASGAGPVAGGSPARQPAAAVEPAAPSKDLAYDVPTGWEKSPGNAFSKAAFKVTDGDQTAEITVTSAGGDLAANINRWRGQLGLAAWSDEELAKEVKSIPVGDASGSYVAISSAADNSPGKSIFGVIAQQNGATWFVKLTGPTSLANREKENFESFVKSLKFK